MDASLISAVSPAAVNLTAEASPGAAQPSMRGADFANLLGHLMDPGARQDLAAAGLQALPISSQIEVITVAEPLPDAASLAAFARGQGLDETTVRALFGAAPGMMSADAAGAAALMQPGSAKALGDGQATLTDKGADTSTLISAALALGGFRPLVVQPLEQAAAMLGEGSAAPSAEEVALQQSLALATGALVPGLMGRGQVAKAPADTGKTPLSVSATLPGAAAQAAGISAIVQSGQVSQLSWQVQSVGAPQAALAVHELGPQAAAVSSALPEVQPEDMPEVLRLRLAPSEFITQRLAAMAGTGEQATWGSVAGQSVAAIGLLRLDMRGLGLVGPSGPSAAPAADAPDALETQALEQPDAAGTHLHHEAGRTQNLAPSASTATPWTSTAAQRAEQYEQLAQRMGEALGQRLQSQLERGEWKVQMRLDPAHLGRIDLDLDMSAGGLDAVFRSDNQVTRDLISQGLSRLRESLSQSGTAVANVWVQGDSNRQSGGNPTPGRTPDQRDETASGRDASSEEQLAAQAAARPRRGTSAWDMLA
jgi:flagellar hook-length control protein FliK